MGGASVLETISPCRGLRPALLLSTSQRSFVLSKDKLKVLARFSAPLPMKLRRACASMDHHHLEIDAASPSRPDILYSPSDRLHHAVNVSSKWVGVAIVVAVVLWARNDQVLWAVTGSVLNAGSSKVLKKVFNQQRPLTALGLKADPGMPSSHAQSFGYLSLYAALSLIFWQGLHILTIAAAATILLCGSYLAWLRISQGLHSASQVIVGAVFGCCMASVWMALWHYLLRGAVASSVVYHYIVVCLFGLSSLCFVGFGVRKWRLGAA